MRFSSMPTGAKVGAGAVGGIAVLGAVYPLMRYLPARWFYYVMLGTVLVGVLTGLFGWLVQRSRKRKAKPMEGDLKDHGASAPQGVSEPARRARLDDLRKNFEGGLEKFHAAGKNIYSLPWYVIVGEPGSGKTEAIRHCNVGFPPGLQDQLQGVGGTINMNWWFTNHAIVLDTAGRLMFEEVEAATSSEWREFLKLLRANRPNCPINGMLLVLPADSLIKDTADALERKGAKIAQQLDQIQRALGVRFPVFVMVTKCDLINGFREFFDDLTDPQLQHQIMGWSNPAPLDEAFNPELVDQHLQTVVERLERRRLGLLLDPVNSEDPSARRTDQVDALYAFPRALMAIAPRLRRYLEMIFVAGEWSAKPLFLRGIYFTSSMREGSALDADLAEVLGVPVESLPEGRVWERERAYFLRDLFMNKIFREKGLVTSASNAKGRQRRRKLVVLGAGFLSIIILALFTWWGYASFSGSIGDEVNYWRAAAEEKNWIGKEKYWQPIVWPILAGSRDYSYNGDTQITLSRDAKVATAQFHHRTMELVQKDVHVPYIFSLAAVFGSDINDNRRRAQRILFEAGVLRPLIDAVRMRVHRLPSPGPGSGGPDTKKPRPLEWSAKATAALEQLVRLEGHHVHTPSAYAAGQRRIDPNSLVSYVVRDPNSYQKYRRKDRQRLNEILKWTYTEGDQGGDQPWPGPTVLWPNDPNSRRIVDKGVDHFVEHWRKGGGIKESEILDAIEVLKQALARYGDAEGRLLAVHASRYQRDANLPATVVDADQVAAGWGKSYGDVFAEGKKIEGALAAARLGVRSLEQTVQATIAEKLKRAEEPHTRLIGAAMPSAKAAAEAKPDEGKAPKGHLQSVAGKLGESLGLLKAQYEKAQDLKGLRLLDSSYLEYVDIRDATLRKRLEAERLRLFDVRLRMYADGNAVLVGEEQIPTMEELPAAVARVNMEANRGGLAIGDLLATNEGAFRFKEAAGVSRFMGGRIARRKRIYQLVKGVLDNAPKTHSDVADRVTQAAKDADKFPPIKRPYIPGTNFKKGDEFPPEYHPKAAAATFRGWQTIATYVEPPAPDPTKRKPSDVLDREKLKGLYKERQGAYKAYLDRYQMYWGQTLLRDLAYNSPNYKKFREDLIGMQARTVTSNLYRLGKTILESLQEVRDVVPDDIRARYNARTEEFAQDLEGFQDPRYVSDWQRWLRKWKNLGADIDKARRDILEKKPGAFIDEYMPFTKGTDAKITERYWKELSYAGLRLLANEVHLDVQAAYNQLQKFSRFPLGSAKTKPLTPAEMVQARAALMKVLGGSQRYAAGTIGAGARTETYPDIDRQLNRLCGRGLGDDELKWCDRVKGVVSAMPAPRETCPCIVSVLPVKVQDEYTKAGLSVRSTWLVVQIDDGKGYRTTQLDAKEIGKLAYPSTDVVFRFYLSIDDYGKKRIDRTKSFSGPWAVLRMLHAPVNAKRVDKDGKRWHVELVINDSEGRSRSLWLELKFEKELPKLSDWP